MNTKKRPIFQAVFEYHYPVTAIVSVLHRITGVILFLLIPFMLWLLHKSLVTPEGFSQLQDFFGKPLVTVLLWLTLAAFLFHLVAGIRHMIMDMGYGESLKVGRLSSYLVFIISLILLFIVGMSI